MISLNWVILATIFSQEQTCSKWLGAVDVRACVCFLMFSCCFGEFQTLESRETGTVNSPDPWLALGSRQPRASLVSCATSPPAHVLALVSAPSMFLKAQSLWHCLADTWSHPVIRPLPTGPVASCGACLQFIHVSVQRRATHWIHSVGPLGSVASQLTYYWVVCHRDSPTFCISLLES